MSEPTQPNRIPFTIEVTPAQKRKIERRAEQEGLSPEAVVLAALNHGLQSATSDENGTEADAQSESLLEATRDLAGSVKDPDAPSDLSCNPKYMEGYGQ